MRENETRIGGLHWGMFSIFEPAQPRPGRVIDQSVVAWRLASRATGAAGFDNPRTVQQQKFGLVSPGRTSLLSQGQRIQYNVDPELFNVPPYNPEELARSGPLFPRRPMTAGEVRMRMEEERIRNPSFRYPTEAEVARTERYLHNLELQTAMEQAFREYIKQTLRMVSEPAPPGFREAMEAVRRNTC